jgi:hypothetical protein
MGAWLALAMALAVSAQPVGGAEAKRPTRLFSEDQPIRATIRGPISAVVSTPAPARTARPATLELTVPAVEKHAIQLSPRGLTRRQKDRCTFPPLRVEFTGKPDKTSLFERQKRLKLTTHCRNLSGHQQHVLLEYAAYRMLNIVSPTSLRARLGSFDYADTGGRVIESRIGFFVEDPDDAASRSGLKEIRTNARIAVAQLDPAAAARAALFEYMIGNTDWSMRAGPQGDICCHNFRLFGAAATSQSAMVPVPYDFDASGLVDAPYAVPSESLGMNSVRERRFRGYCSHNSHALAAAAEFRAKQPQIVGLLSTIPGLDERRRAGAAAYLDSFFRDISTDETLNKRVLKTCIN